MVAWACPFAHAAVFGIKLSFTRLGISQHAITSASWLLTTVSKEMKAKLRASLGLMPRSIGDPSPMEEAAACSQVHRNIGMVPEDMCCVPGRGVVWGLLVGGHPVLATGWARCPWVSGMKPRHSSLAGWSRMLPCMLMKPRVGRSLGVV